MSKETIFDNKNVLVLGGAGFIGSHLCDELIKDSKVICVDDFSSGDEKNIDHLLADPNFKFIKHDMSQPLDLENLPELSAFKIAFQGIQEIYNLACPTSPRFFKENIIRTLSANSYSVKNALDLAVKYDSKFIQFSSSVVYGENPDQKLKISEEYIGRTDILSERSCYDEGKRFAETMVINYKRTFKLKAKIIRLFRIYGPRMKLNDDQMIPDFISNALDDKDILIYGNKDFSSSFCYVSDVIDAVKKLIENETAEVVNVGSDTLINFTTLAEKIIKNIESKSKITYADPILFMTPLGVPDISKALNELGWLPIVTLERGLEKTIYDLRASKGLKSVNN